MSDTQPTDRQVAFIARSSASRDCCKQKDNLVRKDTSPTTCTNTCRVCGANHYYMRAEPMDLLGKP